MANLVKSTIITEVRRRLDEITLSGETATLDTDLEDLASSSFSDTDLGNRINDSAKYIASQVRAMYLPDLIETVPASRFHDYSVLRLLGSRVKVDSALYGSVIATRRTFQGQRKLQATGVEASEQYPAYVFEDWDFKVFPDPVDTGSSTSVTADIVRVPGSPAGATLSTIVDAVTELDDRFTEAVIERTLVYCFFSLSLINQAIEAQNKLYKLIQPYVLPRINLLAQQQNGSASK